MYGKNDGPDATQKRKRAADDDGDYCLPLSLDEYVNNLCVDAFATDHIRK